MNGIYLIFLGLLCTAVARRNLFESKCKRTCNTEQGTFDCWKETTDGFAYGLSTTMIDFCQMIINNRQWRSISSCNNTRAILLDQIAQYDLDDDVKQLTKDDIQQIAISLLDQCFLAPPRINSSEPSCPSCTDSETRRIQQWRLSSIVIVSIGAFLFVVILVLYFCQSYAIRRLHTLMK